MKKFIMFILTLAAFIFSLFPLMMAFIFVFAGKQSMIDFITQIPPERFWLLGIPLFIICMAASVGTLMYMISLSSPHKVAKPLSVDDPDLSRKLSKLYL